MKKILTLLLIIFIISGCSNEKETTPTRISPPIDKTLIQKKEQVKEKPSEVVITEPTQKKDISSKVEDKNTTEEDDITRYRYWVVFYNPDGNELYRTTLKYGETPTYEGEDPYYQDVNYWYNFVCWTDKKGNDVKEFKPITGNTYFYAKYVVGGPNKHEEKKTNIETIIHNPESSTPIFSCDNNSNYLVYCNSIETEANIDVYYLKTGGYKKIANISDLSLVKCVGDLSVGMWSHTNDNPLTDMSITFLYCTNKDSHTFVDPCFLQTGLLHITGQAGGAYFHWDYYDYNVGTGEFVINSDLSNSTSWINLTSGIVNGKWYHVEGYFASPHTCTYTECPDVSIDHVIAS